MLLTQCNVKNIYTEKKSVDYECKSKEEDTPIGALKF